MGEELTDAADGFLALEVLFGPPKREVKTAALSWAYWWEMWQPGEEEALPPEEHKEQLQLWELWGCWG